MPATMNFSNHREAVLATLAFFDQFEYPLTAEEVERYLLQQAPDRHVIDITLRETKAIHHQGAYHGLQPLKKLIEERKNREANSQKWWEKVDRFRWVLGLMPYIRGVSVCNTLAYNNANENSDIDLLVITDPRRLFMARLFLTIALQLWGIRRHGKKVAGRFCLSFFITSDQLNLETIQKGPYDIYLGYWMRTLKPILGTKELHEQMNLANQSWTSKFFSAPREPDFEQWKATPQWIRLIQRIKEWPFNNKIGDALEERLAHWQLQRARKKQEQLGLSTGGDSSIVLTRNMLKFHNVDRRNAIYAKWENQLKMI